MSSEKGTGKPPPPSCTDKLLWDVWMSAYHFPSLTVADELGLFNLLNDTPLSAADVAGRLTINLRGAESLLGMLTALGFLEQYEGRFFLSEVSRNFLLPEGPYYWGPMLKLYQDPALGHKGLLEALLKDRRPDRERSTEEWSTGHLARERARELTAGMHSHSFPAATGLAGAFNFQGVKNLLDVGGGSGCFCIVLAQHHPSMSFTVLELPVVAGFTQDYITEAGLAGRITVVEADMFHDPWPAGHDAVLLSNILHDWDEDRRLWLCQNCFEILPPGGQIYLHTMLLEDTRDAPLATIGFSMNMVVRTEGKQLSALEASGLLGAAGFTDVSITPTYSYYSLVAARKPVY